MSRKLIVLWGIIVIAACFLVTYKMVTFDPKEYVQSQYYTYQCGGGACNVYLSSSIGEESMYVDLYNLIENSSSRRVITLHLSGRGGYMSTVYHLSNAIVQSKAQVNTIVEGPVYSAHAFIAMLGHKITIMPNSQLLFHLPAVQLTEGGDAVLPDQACTGFGGRLDRGQDAVLKCLKINRGEQAIFDRMFKVYIAPYLTNNEKTEMYRGNDIVISGLDMIKRMQNYVR